MLSAFGASGGAYISRHEIVASLHRTTRGPHRARGAAYFDCPGRATATYTDTDGDLVTVKVSKGTLDPGGANFIGIASGMGGQLQQLDLTDPAFAGANITITAVPAEPGDGFVNVGSIDATGFDLGSINVTGPIGTIKIAGHVTGGLGDGAGVIHSGGDIKTVQIGGNLFGGTANRTGLIEGVKAAFAEEEAAGPVR
jgi:hypothetical protein